MFFIQYNVINNYNAGNATLMLTCRHYKLTISDCLYETGKNMKVHLKNYKLENIL